MRIVQTIVWGAFIALLAGSVKAEQDDCHQVQIDTSRLGPVRNETKAGSCFAFVTADLFNFRYGTQVSPSDISLAYLRKAGRRKTFEQIANGGGFTVYAAEQAGERGLCSEEQFHLMPSEPSVQLRGPASVSQGNRGGSAWAEREIESQLRTEGLEKRIKNAPADSVREARLSEGSCQGRGLLSAKGMGTNLGVIEHFEDSENTKKLSAIGAVADQFCATGKRLQPPPKIEHANYRTSWSVGEADSRNRFMHSIDQQLDRKNLVAVYYKPKFMVNRAVELKGHSHHASTIVARRKSASTGQCEYLLRNSWGTDCRAKSAAGKDLGEKYRFPCQAGQIWVPRSEFVLNVTGFTYIK